MVTPQPRAGRTIAQLHRRFHVVVYATDPSAIEAAVLIAAGADAYVANPRDLRSAVSAIGVGETWFSPVAAAAVCRLARLAGDPSLLDLAAAARATAAGHPWQVACQSLGLRATQSDLHRLRQHL